LQAMDTQLGGQEEDYDQDQDQDQEEAGTHS
jgi:hypothetical protein